MGQILYDLDDLIVGNSPFEATHLQFTSRAEIGMSESPNRDRSFSGMLGLVTDELPLVSLDFTGTDVVTIAWYSNQSVGLSIVRVEGKIGFDHLTWIHPTVRHCGLGTMMKMHALGRAVGVGVTRLWGNGDPGSSAFYRILGLVPA